VFGIPLFSLICESIYLIIVCTGENKLGDQLKKKDGRTSRESPSGKRGL